jgi:hypothetical protein
MKTAVMGQDQKRGLVFPSGSTKLLRESGHMQLATNPKERNWMKFERMMETIISISPFIWRLSSTLTIRIQSYFLRKRTRIIRIWKED